MTIKTMVCNLHQYRRDVDKKRCLIYVYFCCRKLHTTCYLLLAHAIERWCHSAYNGNNTAWCIWYCVVHVHAHAIMLMLISSTTTMASNIWRAISAQNQIHHHIPRAPPRMLWVRVSSNAKRKRNEKKFIEIDLALLSLLFRFVSFHKRIEVIYVYCAHEAWQHQWRSTLIQNVLNGN